MAKHHARSVALLVTLVFGLSAAPLAVGAALPGTVFRAFTSHIQRQVDVDKRSFVDASTCIEWFYKRQRQQPSEPRSEGIEFRQEPAPARDVRAVRTASIDCRSRYPGGLDAAREDFSGTQSTLSLSLTFYEFALVGDRDDDGRYSPVELRDILESFGLLFGPEFAPAVQVSTLNAHFDSVHGTGQFDVLMNGMELLFEKGYRFTSRDVEALSKVMG